MCRAGSAQIVGWSISNRQAASHWSVYPSTPMPVASPNPCLLLSNDVATAVLWTIDSCTRPNQSCAGTFCTLYYLMPESFLELVADANNTQGVKRHGEMGISSSPPSTSTGEQRKPRERTGMLRTAGYSAIHLTQSTDRHTIKSYQGPRVANILTRQFLNGPVGGTAMLESDLGKSKT